MAAAAHAINGYPSKLVELRSKNRKRASAPPPLFISTSPSHVNPRHLADLFASSNLSCHRFPNVDPLGRVEPVDIHKLRVALSHSSVVVSIFCRPEDVTTAKSSPESLKLGDLFRRVMPVTHSNGQLVGFGRAVSDSGLTASIYDVMVDFPLLFFIKKISLFMIHFLLQDVIVGGCSKLPTWRPFFHLFYPDIHRSVSSLNSPVLFKGLNLKPKSSLILSSIGPTLIL